MLKILFILTLACLLAPARADEGTLHLTPPEQLAHYPGVNQQVVRVHEPHLGRNAQETVEYTGFPAAAVFDALFGPSWRNANADIEFRALDGYISRIESARFSRYVAYLVYARKDGEAFQVDNVEQHEMAVPLGPYYLVWDNLTAPELLSEGGSDWPYQVDRIGISHARARALLPDGLAPAQAEAARLTQRHCLVCHQINGYGGDKMPINLASIAKGMTRAAFLRRVLDPNSVNPGTPMPPLPPLTSPAEREQVAERIFHYLLAIPVQGE
jgi:mono/diheme cytochrome c family protein